jgi:hypothetical protein
MQMHWPANGESGAQNFMFQTGMLFDVSECGWKFINCLVETQSSCEVSECGWRIINWLVEFIASCEVRVGGSLLTERLNSS